MKIVFFLAALTAVYCSDYTAKHTPPKVMVYSFGPAKYKTENTLICSVSGFHPPDISIQLFKDGAEVPYARQTDLAFGQKWQFHLMKSVGFTPLKGEKYACKVTHGLNERYYAWEPNM